MPNFKEQTYKSILNRKKWIDNWFWDRYSINPYSGCSIGCVYCDARSQKYRNPDAPQLDPAAFEQDIFIKKGAEEILEKKLASSRSLEKDVVALSGKTDCYQPAEKVFRNTRKLLQVLQRESFPVHIVTKSNLVLDDVALLQSIAQETWAAVSVTITTADAKKSKFLDNKAANPSKRFKIVETIKKNFPEIKSGILAIPLVPGLADDPKDLDSLFAKTKDSGADYILFGGGMTLRDQQALWFLENLKNEFPELLPLYEKLYRFRYRPTQYKGQMAPDGKYLLEKHHLLFEIAKKYQLPIRIPRYIPDDYRNNNYRLAEELFKEAYTRQMLGGDWHGLFWGAHNIQNFNSDILTLSEEERSTALNLKEGLLEGINEWVDRNAKGREGDQLWLKF
ncbi:MAG: radical SAM protein [Saprospiraceae bacterium]